MNGHQDINKKRNGDKQTPARTMGEVIWLLAKSLHERGALAFITWSGVFVFFILL
jgi:hypothetical protein